MNRKITPLEKLDFELIIPKDKGNYSAFISMVKLLSISPKFIDIIKGFRSNAGIKGKEFSREDVWTLGEELHTDWKPNKHPYKVNYSFSKYIDHDQALNIFKLAEETITEMIKQEDFRSAGYLIPGFAWITLEIMLTNKLDIRWGYDNGIQVSSGKFLYPREDSVYIEIPHKMAIHHLLEKIKEQKSNINWYFDSYSLGKAPETFILQDYEIEILKYGYGRGKGKYTELAKVLDKYKSTEIEAYTDANLRFVFQTLKQKLTKYNLDTLFV